MCTDRQTNNETEPETENNTDPTTLLQVQNQMAKAEIQIQAKNRSKIGLRMMVIRKKRTEENYNCVYIFIMANKIHWKSKLITF